MQSIRLIEVGLHRNSLEKERIKRNVAGLCQIGKDPVEGPVIGFAPVRRRQHAEKQHFGTNRLDLLDHFVEIVVNRRRIDAAQRVVGAQGEDHQIGLVGERPIEPGQPARGGVARDAAIDDARVDAVLAQPPLEARREGLFGHQPITRGQAVAKIEHHRRPRQGRQRGAEQRRRHGDNPHRVEKPARGAIWSGIPPPLAGRCITRAGLPRRPSWLG